MPRLGVARMLSALAVVVALVAAQPCGKIAGQGCTTEEDPCCSVFSYCGSTPDHCGMGCQPDYSFEGNCAVPPQPNVTVVSQCLDPTHVAITFDDGPFAFTADMAKAFSDAGAFVTFFMNGMNYDCIYNYADTVLAAKDAGHQIASHTWSHKDLQTLTRPQIDDEMQKLNFALKKIIGASPVYMRPPFGSYNKDALFALADNNISHVVMWDADSGDSTGATFEEEKATYSALDSRNGHVILNHDPLALTAQQLAPFIIEWAQERSLQMVTIGTCLGHSKDAWYTDYVEPETRNPTWVCE